MRIVWVFEKAFISVNLVVSCNTMRHVLKSILAFCICVLFCTCTSSIDNFQEDIEEGSLTLKLEFKPAFCEHSEIELVKTGSTQNVRLLIHSNSRVALHEDTFYFKNVPLTNKEFLRLDATLIKLCRERIPRRNVVILDGMTISSLLVSASDSNFIYLHSPGKDTDSAGYIFTKSVFEILKATIQDTISRLYFDDIESYIDESKLRKADPRNKIDQLRIKKYGWSIGNTN